MGVLYLILIASIVALLIGISKLPSKGKAGELHVAKILSKLPPEKYKVINDLLINKKDHTSQIDHIVVSKHGIFVIETKNYTGWICGSEDSEYWTQNIYGSKHNMWNPLLQNKGHIRALAKILKDIQFDSFISIITFSRDAELKIKTTKHVIYWDQTIDVILSYQEEMLSTIQVEKIYNTLLTINENSEENINQHIINVKARIYNRQKNIENGYCPRCGGRLVLREGKYGRFYGCEKYPHCKFTHPV